jgi:hypothetical protein
LIAVAAFQAERIAPSCRQAPERHLIARELEAPLAARLARTSICIIHAVD